VVPTSIVGVDSFDKMRFRFIAGHPSLSLWETELGGRDEVSPFDLIAQLQTGIIVLSTVVPSSFMGVDSFEKMRSRFIAGHPLLLLRQKN
jgi:hypothetical protein